MTEKEKGSLGAVGGVSEDEAKLLEALHLLGIKPKLSSPEDVAKLIKVFGGVKDEPDVHTTMTGTTPKAGTYHFPKLSTFYGEEGKGEVTWDTFRYEVQSILTDKAFTDEQILLGVRRALKGSASDKVRRLGPGVTIKQVLEKLESAYGMVESRESIMKKFYTCEQKSRESVEMFASRLEELFDKAVELKGFKRTDTEILKQVLHSGLRKELKHMSVYQCDKIAEYDEFKKELRKIESDTKDEVSSEEKKGCKATVNIDKKESSELSEVKRLLKGLNDRIDGIEKEKEQTSQYQFNRRPWYSDRGYSRGGYSRGTFRGRGQGRGEYRPQRPTGMTTFQPLCYLCGQRGHIQRNCPRALSQIECYNCFEKGHKKINCPKV